MDNDFNVAARVANGVALLNEKVPGWRDRIDLQTFDINSFQKCVLAQLYGSYFDGVAALGLERGNPEKDPGNYAFDHSLQTPFEELYVEGDALQEGWLQVLKA